MKTKLLVRLLTGSLMPATLVLAYLASPWWLMFAAIVGTNSIASAFPCCRLAELPLQQFGWNSHGRTEIHPPHPPAKTA